MAEENNVTFSKKFLIYAENMAVINAVTAAMPEKLAKQTKLLLCGFAKRGIPAQTVLEVLTETTMEGGFNDG